MKNAASVPSVLPATSLDMKTAASRPLFRRKLVPSRTDALELRRERETVACLSWASVQSETFAASFACLLKTSPVMVITATTSTRVKVTAATVTAATVTAATVTAAT
eukprot:6177118-Pleurochrysis_carterae.AAC.2